MKVENKTFLEQMLSETKKCAAGFEAAAINEKNLMVKNVYKRISETIRNEIRRNLIFIKNSKNPIPMDDPIVRQKACASKEINDGVTVARNELTNMFPNIKFYFPRGMYSDDNNDHHKLSISMLSSPRSNYYKILTASQKKRVSTAVSTIMDDVRARTHQ